MNQWMFLFDGYGIDYSGTNPFPESHTGDAYSDAATQDVESWPNIQKTNVFQPYMIKFMCNRSAFHDPTDPDMQDVATQFVDYSGWQFKFYKVERTILPEEADFSAV